MAGYSIRPDVKEFIDFANKQAAKRTGPMDVEKMRLGSEKSRELCDVPTGPLAVDRWIELPGPGGILRARIFDAREKREAGPVALFFHGGGFVVCSANSHEAATAEMARRLDIPIVSLDYRQAPENPWPAAHDDAEAAARWLASTQSQNALGFAPDSLLLAGDSAGGNLALATALALRDKPAGLQVKACLLFFPLADRNMRGASYEQFSEGFIIDKKGLAFFGECYKVDPDSSRAAPIRQELAGLPPVILNTCELDPLRDQGRAMAEKLAASGVSVFQYESKGLPHAWLTCRKVMPSSERDLRLLLDVTRTVMENS